MNKTSFHILRVGLAITFLWIGVLILKEPGAWAGYMAPWAVKLLPLPVEEMMRGTAILDILIGALLLLGVGVWVASLVAALHLAVVLVVSGITDITVRDIGLLTGSLALMIETLPKNIFDKFKSRPKINY